MAENTTTENTTVENTTVENTTVENTTVENTAAGEVEAEEADEAVASGETLRLAFGAVFSEAGLEEMRAAHPAAAKMSVETGVGGIPVPLHAGAARFFSEQGVEVSEEIAPTE